MNRTKIEWADFVWNPIKGLCPQGCAYCYAWRTYMRFGLERTVRFDLDELQAPIYTHTRRPAGSRIFVCSTFELFHPSVPKDWRDKIFGIIEFGKRDTWIVLTKRPDLIDRRMPDNVWLGTSVTGLEDWWRVERLQKNASAGVKFVSLEPFMGTRPSRIVGIDWLIIGRMTGFGHEFDPRLEDIEWLVEDAHGNGIPVFLKNNLAGIWDRPLIQEFPEARASSNGRTSALQADDPGSSPGARSMNPKGEK